MPKWMTKEWLEERNRKSANFGKLVKKNAGSHAQTKPIPFNQNVQNDGNINLRIVIHGQVMGGKNNICITRTGRRFPNKKWAAWRDDAVNQVRMQVGIQSPRFEAITESVSVRVTYIAGDRRRRDCPAILDAVWHVLEKAGIVADDTLLWPIESSRSYEKESPRCEIEILSL